MAVLAVHVSTDMEEASQSNAYKQWTTRVDFKPVSVQPAERERITFAACFLGLVASIGGLIFGYVR